MAKNPFQALGLSPSALAGKNDQQIKRLVQLVGRALAQVEHPDAGGDAERFNLLQNALAELGDSKKFSRAKERFLLAPQKQADKLQGLLDARTQQLGYARWQLRAYLESLVKRDNTPSVTRPDSLTLVMRDVVRNQFSSGSYPQSAPLVTLHITGEGMEEERKGLRKKTARKLVGGISPKVFEPPHHIHKLIHQCQESKSIPRAQRQLGSRTVDVIIPAPKRISNLIGWKQAGPILELLTPGLEPYHHLFSLLYQSDVPHLYYEGQMVELKKHK